MSPTDTISLLLTMTSIYAREESQGMLDPHLYSPSQVNGYALETGCTMRRDAIYRALPRGRVSGSTLAHGSGARVVWSVARR